MSIYDLQINSLDNSHDIISSLHGKVCLFVNVASRCGLTPQYQQLQELHQQYSHLGFTVIGVPCNQFGLQEPGSPKEIQDFCTLNYSVTFPLTEKIEVNGPNRHPLYIALTSYSDPHDHNGDIRWNFEKFLVDKNGFVANRFSPETLPNSSQVVEAVSLLLNL